MIKTPQSTINRHLSSPSVNIDWDTNTYLKSAKKNLNIEKITFKVVQIKFLAITN